MTTGQRIKVRRKEIGVSAEYVAEKLGVSPATIYRYENGDIEKVPGDRLAPIAKILQTTPQALMGWEMPTPAGEKVSCALRIRQGLAIRGMNQKDLCEKTGIPKSAMSQYCSGAFTPKQDRTTLIAQALDVNEAWLMGYDVPMERDTHKPQLLPSNVISIDPPTWHQIPILGRISAGLPLYAEEHIEGYTLTDLNGGAEYFALRVHGDSMNAIGINDGYIIIVRRQEEVENGEVAVVMVGENDATVKRFYSSGDTVTLLPQSTNPSHKPQIYNTKVTNIRVLGKVKKVEFSV